MHGYGMRNVFHVMSDGIMQERHIYIYINLSLSDVKNRSNVSLQWENLKSESMQHSWRV